MSEKDQQYLVVITYDRKNKVLWQVIDRAGTVLSQFPTKDLATLYRDSLVRSTNP